MVSKDAEVLRPMMSAMSTHQWEQYNNKRYFHMSKVVAARLRHGWPAGPHSIVMDSAGWVDSEMLTQRLNAERGSRLQNVTLDDLAIIASTGTKG